MRKTSLLIRAFIAFGIPDVSFAEPVSPEIIEKIAKYWIKNNASFKKERHKKPNLKFEIKSVEKIFLDSEELPAYIVKLEPTGYLIISADDDLPSILSYSQNSGIDLSLDKNNGFRQLLKNDLKAGKEVIGDKKSKTIQEFKQKNKQRWKKNIQAAESTDLSSSDEQPSAYDMPLSSAIVVDEMLQTRWNQNNHYNELVPESNAVSSYYDGHVPTGCLATAFAQLMKYHNWPWFGRGTHSYTDNSGSIQGSHLADFSDIYEWANMQNSYDLPEEPAIAVEAVSNLMYEVGIGSEMDYEPDGSSAYYLMHGRLAANFYYNRGDYVTGTTDIINTLVDEMASYAPAVVSNSSHAMVVDGHSTESSDNYFHVNYGWGGTNDGWYLINSIPGGGLTSVFAGNVPRPIPLAVQSNGIGNPWTLHWQFPEYFVSAEDVRVYEGRLESHDVLIDSADDFSHWERAEGDASQWTIMNGQFHWSRNTLYTYNSLEFAGPVIPTSDTVLTFDIDASIADESVTLEISTDEGKNWTILQSWSSSIDTSYAIDLSAYAGAELRIRFNAIYEYGSYYTQGVLIDNISLSNCKTARFQEKDTDIASDLNARSIEFFNLTPGSNYYRLQTLHDGVWSDLSPVLSIIAGDVNGDGTVNLADAITSLKVATNRPVNDIELAGDLNSDGKIGMVEAIKIFRYLNE